jgi:hypothetical protein
VRVRCPVVANNLYRNLVGTNHDLFVITIHFNRSYDELGALSSADLDEGAVPGPVLVSDLMPIVANEEGSPVNLVGTIINILN